MKWALVLLLVPICCLLALGPALAGTNPIENRLPTESPFRNTTDLGPGSGEFVNLGCTTCPPGAVIETETDCGLPVDMTNGGCNFTPEAFTDLDCADQSVCGTAAFDGNFRDLDWYRLVLPGPVASLTASVTAEFLPQVGILDFVTGTCLSQVVLDNQQGLSCTAVTASTGPLVAGTYVVVVAPSFSNPELPCPAKYTLTISGTECTPTDCSIADYKTFSRDFEPPWEIADPDDNCVGGGCFGPGGPFINFPTPDDGTTIEDVVVDLKVSHSRLSDLGAILFYLESCDLLDASAPPTRESLQASGVPYVVLMCRQASGDKCGLIGPGGAAGGGGSRAKRINPYFRTAGPGYNCEFVGNAAAGDELCCADLSCEYEYRFTDAGGSEIGADCPGDQEVIEGGCFLPSSGSPNGFSVFSGLPKGGCFVLLVADLEVGETGVLCAAAVHVKNSDEPTHELCCINNECVELEIGQCEHRGGVIVTSCADCGTPPPTHELCCTDGVCTEVEIGQCDHGTVVTSCTECGTPPPTHELCCINNECFEVEIGQCDHQGGVIVTSCADCGTPPPTHELCCINDVCTEVEIGQCDHQGGVLVNSCDECGDHGPQTELCCITPMGAAGVQECVEVPIGDCAPRGGTVVENCDQCNDHGPQTELCCSHGQCTEVAIDTCTGLGGTVVSSCTECGIQPHAPPVRLIPGEGEVELSLSRGDREPVLAPVLPNPFVSTTAVFYALPSAALVRLSVYDASGRLVDRLVERAESAGVHVAEWDGSGHPSGVYFFRLEVGSEVRVRRAILSK